jgi:GH18 family chitinase
VAFIYFVHWCSIRYSCLIFHLFLDQGVIGCHGEAGNVPYFEIDEKYIKTGKYDSLKLNERTASMELVTGGNSYFTSYDSPETFNMKYKYVFSQCLRGIMW